MSQWNAKVKMPSEGQQGRGAQQDRGGAASAGKSRAGNSDLKAALDSARALFQAKRHDEALRAFEAILEKNPDAVPAYLGIGNVHAAQGHLDDALEYYAGALHIKKDFAPAMVMS
ncbi:MAG TPA: tetratricopeptide repeat protein, partial [Rhodoferax sp.]|nr:tetratricopeptide repeat protein [Rhodoferax sp.]